MSTHSIQGFVKYVKHHLIKYYNRIVILVQYQTAMGHTLR